MDQKIVVGNASAKVIAASMYQGSILTTLEVEFPRPYLAEFNTHKVLSKNSASSRAIPVWKRMVTVKNRPYVPNSFGVNKSGMQAGEEMSDKDKEKAIGNWLRGRDLSLIQCYYLVGGKEQILKDSKNNPEAMAICEEIENLTRDYGLRAYFSNQDRGLHKQHANRVIETYSFHTVVVTGTYWRNFLGLRPSKNAQPEAQDFGIAIGKAMMGSNPVELKRGEWHLPYIRQEDRDEVGDQLVLARASSGKCARTSYLTHDGIRALGKDLEMVDGLQGNGHMSPFEHPARPREEGDPVGSNGNLNKVWTQYRKLITNEHDFTKLILRQELVEGCRGDEALVDFILALPE